MRMDLKDLFIMSDPFTDPVAMSDMMGMQPILPITGLVKRMKTKMTVTVVELLNVNGP